MTKRKEKLAWDNAFVILGPPKWSGFFSMMWYVSCHHWLQKTSILFFLKGYLCQNACYTNVKKKEPKQTRHRLFSKATPQAESATAGFLIYTGAKKLSNPTVCNFCLRSCLTVWHQYMYKWPWSDRTRNFHINTLISKALLPALSEAADEEWYSASWTDRILQGSCVSWTWVCLCCLATWPRQSISQVFVYS